MKIFQLIGLYLDSEFLPEFEVEGKRKSIKMKIVKIHGDGDGDFSLSI